MSAKPVDLLLKRHEARMGGERMDGSYGGAVDDFLLALAAGGRKRETLSAYAHTLDRLGSKLGFPELASIRPEALYRAVLALAAAPGRHGASPAETTLNRYRSTLRVFFRWAFETRRVGEDLSGRLRGTRAASNPTAPFPGERLLEFLALIRSSGDRHALRDEALFATYAFAGVRRAEALCLRVGDVDLRQRMLRVRPRKGGPGRFLPIHGRLEEALSRYLAGASASKPPAPLFPGRDPAASLSERQVNSRFKKWARFAGLPYDLTVHSLRAGFATRLHDRTGDLCLVSRALGHRDIRSTLRYVEIAAGTMREALTMAFC